ncbi:MAG: DUF108 domain-containing protein, partial [Candidatus Omnitrophica bacterium]|nr:DUF108 domain-containing protein [Candidatus Omnitrophota bacterium]
MMENKTIGIIGAGAIGKCLAEYAESHLNRFINQLILFDSDIDKMKTLADKLNNVEIATSMKDLVEKSDLVIEAASAGAVSAIFENVLREGKDLMVMSIGGLLGNEDYLDMARNKGLIVILPSGAIAAIDGLKSFNVGGLEKVTLTTRKAPRSIKGAPYLLENNINVDTFTTETIVFEGNAIEAVKGFPKNVNVSALLSIAGMGAEKTKVRIIVS